MKKFFIYLMITGLFFLNVGKVDALMTFDLGEIVVTASRMAQHGYKIASDVTVIDEEQIEASNARTVSEILQQELGINVYDNGSSKTATVDIRGFGDTATRNVLVLINDRKVNPVDISGPDMLQIPLESVARIEIIRGAGSVLYGDNAVGGVVNIITKKGEGNLSGKVGSFYGSYRTSAQDAEISGAKGDFSYYLYSKYYDTQGYRINSELLAKDYNTRMSYKFYDKLSVDLNTTWHEDQYGLPGGLTDTQLQSLGRRGSARSEDFASTKDRSFQLVLDAKPWLDNIDWGHFIVDLNYRNRDTYALFASFGEFATKRNIDAFGISSKYVFDQTIFDKEFNFVVGTDYYDTDNDILGSGSNSDDLTIAKEEFGAFVFAEYEALNNLFVNVGNRFQQAEYIFDQRATVRSYDTESPDVSVSNFGMKYEYGKGSNVFFDVQQTFRFLATDEWYDSFTGVLNTNLVHQDGIQYQAGVQHTLNDMVSVSATPYWMDIKDEIFFNPSSGFFGSNDNYGKTRRVGIELGQKTDVLKLLNIGALDKLEVTTNYTYQNPRFIDGPNDAKFIPMAPEHQASLGLNMGFLKYYGFSVAGRYVGSRFAINDTLNKIARIKPYFIVDSKLSFKKNFFELYAAINNMFDEQYFTYVSMSEDPLTSVITKSHFPAAERNYVVGVNLKF